MGYAVTQNSDLLFPKRTEFCRPVHYEDLVGIEDFIPIYAAFALLSFACTAFVLPRYHDKVMLKPDLKSEIRKAIGAFSPRAIELAILSPRVLMSYVGHCDRLSAPHDFFPHARTSTASSGFVLSLHLVMPFHSQHTGMGSLAAFSMHIAMETCLSLHTLAVQVLHTCT